MPFTLSATQSRTPLNPECLWPEDNCICTRQEETLSPVESAPKSSPPQESPTVLDEAQEAVFGARQSNYGHPRVNFQRIADLWSVIVGTAITPEQTGLMMVCLKIARLMETPDHRDSYVDIAGYAQATARAVGLDE